MRHTLLRWMLFAGLALLPLALLAQDAEDEEQTQTLNGEEVLNTISIDFGPFAPIPNLTCFVTPTTVYGGFEGTFFYRDWTAPKGLRIVRSAKKAGGYTVLIELSDKSVWEWNPLTQNDPVEKGTIGSFGSESWRKVVGDAIYALSSSHLYVSRDTAQTWTVDSTGLNGAYIWDVDLDTLQYVYAATDHGLFMQHPDSSVWHPVTSLTQTNLFTVFIDRRNRILVGLNGSGLYVSTDHGSTWNIDTAGVGSQGFSRYCDDRYGNLYAVVSDPFNGMDRLYVSAGGNSAWQAADAGIASAAGSGYTIDAISGDSVLSVGTSFGVFQSANQGTTWWMNNTNLRSEYVSGFVRAPSGALVASNALGIYERLPGDSVWTKLYPQTGFVSHPGLMSDNSGALYVLDPGLGNYQATPFVRSTDNGTTWQADTAGFSSVVGSVAYVDENGTEHYASSLYGNSFLSEVWQRAPGGSWTIDTSGFPVANYSYSLCMVSDHNGYLYVSGSFGGNKVMRRPIGGGTWNVDTVGFPSTISFLRKLVSGNAGDLIGTTGSVLVGRHNGVWQTLPLPPQLSSPSINAIVADTSGSLFAAFSDYNGSLGVYRTPNAGQTWIYEGFDSVDIAGLVSYGDSTFALTRSAGAFYINKYVQPAGVRASADVLGGFSLSQNYPNPFNPSTTIQFSLPEKGVAKLRVYNLLGQEVAVLFNGFAAAGQHDVVFNADRFASGVYFARLEFGGRAIVKKLLLMK